MKKRNFSSSCYLFFSLIVFLTFPSFVFAAQAESPVACDEAAEPQGLNYGDHTTGCTVTPATDLDQFTFVGINGENVRLNIRSTSNYFDPRIEIRDPGGTVITDQFCSGGHWAGNANACSFSVDLSLTMDGTYFIAVSDSGVNEAGNYMIQIERIPPQYIPPALSYNASISDSITPDTDIDFIEFGGTAGTDIRLNVLSLSNYFDPRIEIRDPGGTVIVDQFCSGGHWAGNANACSFSVDLSLTMDGTYTIAISDSGINEPGNYQVDLQCLFGTCIGVNQPLACDIQMSQASYSGSDMVQASVLRLTNPGASSTSLELKIWLSVPSIPVISAANMGADGSFVLPAGFDQDFGPVDLFAATGMPSGTYELGCRLIDPVTGELLSIDINTFDVN